MTIESYSLSYDDFLEHMRHAGAERTEVNANVETWTCSYAGRFHVLAGTYDRDTQMATLDLL